MAEDDYIGELLKQLHDLAVAENEATAEARRQIEHWDTVRRGIAKQFIEERRTLEQAITLEVSIFQKSYKMPYGTVSYTRPYDRVSWDEDKLMALARSLPAILEAKKVSHVDAKIAIKLAPVEAANTEK